MKLYIFHEQINLAETTLEPPTFFKTYREHKLPYIIICPFLLNVIFMAPLILFATVIFT